MADGMQGEDFASSGNHLHDGVGVEGIVGNGEDEGEGLMDESTNSSGAANVEATSEIDSSVFVPHVHPPDPPYYANSVESYHAPRVLIWEHRISAADGNGELVDSTTMLELVNTLTNRHVHIDCVVRKFVLDTDRMELVIVIESLKENSLD